MLKATETIVKFTVSEKSKENAWADLVEVVVASGCKTSDSIKILLEPAEIEYVEQYHSEDPKAKTKSGRWKTSKYLPNSYKSAKSVVCRAIDAGVELKHGDEILGKSYAEAVIRSKKLVDVTKEIEKHTKALKGIASVGFDEDVKTALLDSITYIDRLKEDK